VRLLDHMIATHLMGPMIVVLPQMSTSTDFQECVDGPHGQDDTYITDDVRNDVLAQFRASTEPAEWGIAGYSSGGYCAANLALRHRAMFGAAGVMDGYFRPTDGPAAAALGNDPAAEAANDPITLARGLTSDTKPLPAFWVSAGTGVAADIAGADAFVASLHGVEQVDLVREPGAGHNFYAWRPALPRVLAWMWTQLAPPYLRVQFPIAGGVHGSVVPARPAPGVSRQADRRQHA
jgi:S-formylglutathione hydrolase FrmB